MNPYAYSRSYGTPRSSLASLPGSAILIVVVLVVMVRLLIGRLNHARIREYLQDKEDARDIVITWKPFGAGWFGEKDSVIYQVQYTARNGDVHEAVCKTGMFSGVYFTEDSIISLGRRSQPDASSAESAPSSISRELPPSLTTGNQIDVENLLAENRRLREENERLRTRFYKSPRDGGEDAS